MYWVGPGLGAGCAALLHHHLQVSHPSCLFHYHLIQEGIDLGEEEKDVCHLHGHDRHHGHLPDNLEDVRLINKEAEEAICGKVEEGARFVDCSGKGGKDGGSIVGGTEQATKDPLEKGLQEKMPEEVVDQVGDGVGVGGEEEGEEEVRKRGVGRGERKGRERKGRQRSFSNSHRFGAIFPGATLVRLFPLSRFAESGEEVRRGGKHVQYWEMEEERKEKVPHTSLLGGITRIHSDMADAETSHRRIVASRWRKTLDQAQATPHPPTVGQQQAEYEGKGGKF